MVRKRQVSEVHSSDFVCIFVYISVVPINIHQSFMNLNS